MTEDTIDLHPQIDVSGRNWLSTGWFTLGIVCGLLSGFVALLLSA